MNRRPDLCGAWLTETQAHPSLMSDSKWMSLGRDLATAEDLDRWAEEIDLDHGEVELVALPESVSAGFLDELELAILDEWGLA